MKRKQIECNHARKGRRFYVYELIGVTLFLCIKCEKVLRKLIKKQIEAEK